MTAEINFQTRFAGVIEGDEVAYLYHAFAEDTKPYVVVLKHDSLDLSLTQEPGDCEFADRENAIQWVKALTELVAKARAYDELTEALFREEEDEPVDLDEDDTPSHLLSDFHPDVVASAFEVDSLTDVEADMEWEDNDGDHYKHIDGQWCFSSHGYSPWQPLFDSEYNLLTDYGPYKAVGLA